MRGKGENNTKCVPEGIEPLGKPVRILRIKDVCARCGVSRATIWRLERAGRFPPRRRLTDHLVGWVEGEIDHWIASRAQWGRL